MKKIKIEIRLDKDTKDRFKKKTSQNGLTMSEEILNMINASLTNEIYENKISYLNKKEIYAKFSHIFNILSYIDGEQKNVLLKELRDLECLL